MFKIIALTLFISTLLFLGLFVRVIELNHDIGLEIYNLKRDLNDHKVTIDSTTDALRECRMERSEWRLYFGGTYGLSQARRYFNAPAK